MHVFALTDAYAIIDHRFLSSCLSTRALTMTRYDAKPAERVESFLFIMGITYTV